MTDLLGANAGTVAIRVEVVKAIAGVARNMQREMMICLYMVK